MTNKISITSKCITISCNAKDIESQEKIAQLYPIHYNRAHTEYYLSPMMVPEVLHIMRDIDELNIYTATQKIQELYYDEMRRRGAIAELMSNGPKGDGMFSSRLTLRPHQQLGREVALQRDRFGFFYDTRTGKTPLSLAIMHDDLVAHPNNKWLVVCPLILIDNAWLEDASRFTPDIAMVSCHAATPQKRRDAFKSSAEVFVTNTESFASYADNIKEIGFAGCIVDESSCMKSNKSKISEALVDFAQTVNRFYLLSGTPAANGEWEYYMQLRALDFYGIQQSYTQFKQRYFVNLSFNPQYEKLTLRPDMKDELYDLIKQHAIYVDQSVLELPGRDFEEVIIDMPDKLKASYKQLKDELYLEVKDGIDVLAANAAVKLNKLNQVTSGFIIDTSIIKENKYGHANIMNYKDKDPVYFLDDYRFKALEELLQRPGVKGEQVLIWCTYRKEFEILKSIYKDRCATIYGATSLVDKSKAIADFKSGKVQYLIANPASADKGLTLTNAHIAIYFSLTWSYELFKQSKERIYGAITSQPKHCTYYTMIAKGSIDRILYSDVLQGKERSSMAVLNHLRSDAF